MALTSTQKWTLRILIAVGLVLLLVAVCTLAGTDPMAPQFAWVLGAGALGLMAGLVTGASTQTGIGGQFLTFVSGGILVPLFGGIVALMQFRQGSQEAYTYVGEKIATKTTSVVVPGVEHLHPIWVLGAFFVLYGCGAVVGIVGGMALRESGLSIKLTGD
jgi:hypothetical protein